MRGKIQQGNSHYEHELADKIEECLTGDQCEILDKLSLEIFQFLAQIDHGYRPSKRILAALKLVTKIMLRDKYGLISPKVVNSITSLPLCLDKLSNLNYLDLSFTKIRSLGHSLYGLNNLNYLDLSYSQICIIGDSLYGLHNLQSLDLHNTQIHSLGDSLKDLNELRRLNLSGLMLDQIPQSLVNIAVSMSKMQKEFERNESIFVHNGSFDYGINLSGTHLGKQSIELFQQPLSFIQEQYAEIKQSGSEVLHEAKVVFLGDGNVGKTHTIRRLLNDGALTEKNGAAIQTKQTPDIDVNSYVTKWNGETPHIKIWDFGGQVQMHSMHRCFLTDKTCYVIILSTRTGDPTRQAYYWLKTIQGVRIGSQIILAVNHFSEGEEPEVDIRELRNAFGLQLEEPIHYNAKCDTPEQFQLLQYTILKKATELPIYKHEFSKKAAGIRRTLEKKNEPFISRSDYLSICEENGLDDPNSQRNLLEFFNALGFCFTYCQKGLGTKELENYHVLDPKWLFYGMYRILNLKEHGIVDNGVVNIQGLVDVLNKSMGMKNVPTKYDRAYTTENFDYILEIMRSQELSYPVSTREEFIPATCANPTPEKLWPEYDPGLWDSIVSIEFRYGDFLPDYILHKLMVNCMQNGIGLEQVWHTGMACRLFDGNLGAVVRMNIGCTKFIVDTYSRGNHHPSEFLSPLRKKLYQENQLPEEYVIVKERYHATEFPIDFLLSARMKGKRIVAAGKDEYREYNTIEILRTVMTDEEIETKIRSKRDVEVIKMDINVNGGIAQVNVAKENATINATQNNGYDTMQVEQLENLILRIVETRPDDLTPEEQEQFNDNIEVIRSEAKSTTPRKSFVRIALKGLEAINGTIQFSAAVTQLIQFLNTIMPKG